MQKIAAGAFFKLEHALGERAHRVLKPGGKLVRVKAALDLDKRCVDLNIKCKTLEPVAEHRLDIAVGIVDLKRSVAYTHGHGTGLIEDKAHAARKLGRDAAAGFVFIYNSIAVGHDRHFALAGVGIGRVGRCGGDRADERGTVYIHGRYDLGGGVNMHVAPKPQLLRQRMHELCRVALLVAGTEDKLRGAA